MAGGDRGDSRANEPLVVAAGRTPFAPRDGQLARWHPADLGGLLLSQVGTDMDLDPSMVDQVLIGCVTPVGGQGRNLARNVTLAAGWPDSIPAATVDAQACSSLQCVDLAARSIRSGEAEVVVAGGVECSSTVPQGAGLAVVGAGRVPGERVTARYSPEPLLPGGLVLEGIAARKGWLRVQLDDWAERSRGRSSAGLSWGRVVPVPVEADQLVAGPGLSSYKPLYSDFGRVTAGNTAGEGDGAAVVVLASQAAAKRKGWKPLARLVSSAAGGASPLDWPSAAMVALQKALARAGLVPSEIERWEVHESSSVAVLCLSDFIGRGWADRVNLGGGVLGRSSPDGAAGAALVVAGVAAVLGGAGPTVAVASAEGGVAAAVVLARA